MRALIVFLFFAFLCLVIAKKKKFHDAKHLLKMISTKRDHQTNLLGSHGEKCKEPCAWNIVEKKYQCQTKTFGKDACSPDSETAANGKQCMRGNRCDFRGRAFTNCFANIAGPGETAAYGVVACSITAAEKRKRDAALKRRDEKMIARIMKREERRMKKDGKGKTSQVDNQMPQGTPGLPW